MEKRIKKGDTVKIQTRYAIRQGVVDTVEYIGGVLYGVQLRDPQYGGCYWKDSDGGEVTLLEEGPELMTLKRAVIEARNAEWQNHEMMMALVKKHYPDARVKGGMYDDAGTYSCSSYEIHAAACPPCQVFVFAIRGDKLGQFGTTVLIGDEAQKMDYFLAGLTEWDAE